MRRLLSACAAIVLAALVVVAPVGGLSPVSAAAIAPGIPDPLTVPASVFTGATQNYVGTRAAGMNASLMSKMGKDPRFWNYVKSVSSGTATAAQEAAVTASKVAFRIPALPAGALVKGLGVAGLAATSFDVGGFLGNGAMNIVGVDAEGLVCGQASELLAFFAHQDCGSFKTKAGFDKNAGVDMSVRGGTVCVSGSPGVCATYLGRSTGYAPMIAFRLSGADDSVVWVVVQTVDGFVKQGNTLPISPQPSNGFFPGLAGQPNVTNTGVAKDVLSYCVRLSGAANCDGVAVGHPEDPDPDPPRQWKCDVTLKGGEVLSRLSATFHEGGGDLAPMLCPELPLDVPVTNTTIWEVGGGQSVAWYNQDTSPEYQAAATDFPECMSGTCMLDLVKSGTGSCFSDPDACAGWLSDPSKATDYTCNYGVHAVALSECTPYAPTFKPGAKTSTAPYGDPVTGAPLEGSGPGTSVSPGAVPDPEQPQECFPTGWGVFNPFDWVFKPVGCALRAAFVPRKSQVDKATSGTKAAWESSTPGRLAAALLVFDFAAPSSGCRGLAVPIPTPSSTGGVVLHNRYFLPACSGDFFAPWAPLFSVFIGGAACVTGFFGAARHLGGIFGYGGLGGDA